MSQITVMDTQLIGNNPQEEALIKIRTLQKENRTAAQQEKIEKFEHNLYALFLSLFYSKYGVNKEQLFKFSDDEIESLGEAIYRGVKKTAIISGIFVWIFGLGIPLMGWAMLCDTNEGNKNCSLSKSYSYRRKYSQLRKIFGDKYFSAKRLRELNP